MLGFRELEGRADEREVREAHEREAGEARAFTDCYYYYYYYLRYVSKLI